MKTSSGTDLGVDRATGNAALGCALRRVLFLAALLVGQGCGVAVPELGAQEGGKGDNSDVLVDLDEDAWQQICPIGDQMTTVRALLAEDPAPATALGRAAEALLPSLEAWGMITGVPNTSIEAHLSELRQRLSMTFRLVVGAYLEDAGHHGLLYLHAPSYHDAQSTVPLTNAGEGYRYTVAGLSLGHWYGLLQERRVSEKVRCEDLFVADPTAFDRTQLEDCQRYRAELVQIVDGLEELAMSFQRQSLGGRVVTFISKLSVDVLAVVSIFKVIKSFGRLFGKTGGKVFRASWRAKMTEGFTDPALLNATATTALDEWLIHEFETVVLRTYLSISGVMLNLLPDSAAVPRGFLKHNCQQRGYTNW